LTAATIENIKQSDFHAVIQATTVGSFAQPGSPTPEQTPAEGAWALDMIYHPLQTQWLRSAESAGAIPVVGTAMLIRQMLEQLHASTGLEADFAALNAVLHKELAARAAVLLIGARASGKTSLGRALAAKLGWHFIDADEELERRSQRSIASWIAEDEIGFRHAERDLLPELMALPRHVVGLGGGVVESPTSVQRLVMASRVVFLDCPVKVLVQRQEKEPRPPLSDLPLADEIDHLLACRLPFYQECADLTLSSASDFEEIVERLFFSPVLKLFPA
jgi:shikimate kinase